MFVCPHCGHEGESWDSDEGWDWEPTVYKPYWQEHPISFAKARARDFWRYTILRKKRPVFMLEKANDLLKEIYLPALRAQLNDPSPLAEWWRDPRD